MIAAILYPALASAPAFASTGAVERAERQCRHGRAASCLTAAAAFSEVESAREQGLKKLDQARADELYAIGCEAGSDEACQRGAQLRWRRLDREGAVALAGVGCDRGVADACLQRTIMRASILDGRADRVSLLGSDQARARAEARCREGDQASCVQPLYDAVDGFCRDGSAAACAEAAARQLMTLPTSGVAAFADPPLQVWMASCRDEATQPYFAAVLLGDLCGKGAADTAATRVGKACEMAGERDCAERWYAASCHGGEGPGCLPTARLQLRGSPTEDDAALKAGFALASQLCAKGSADACYLQGEAYRLGTGTAPDPKAARAAYARACPTVLKQAHTESPNVGRLMPSERERKDAEALRTFDHLRRGPVESPAIERGTAPGCVWAAAQTP